MATVFSRTGAHGDTHWYASIYLGGIHKHFTLWVNEKNNTRPSNRTEAEKLAGALERRLKQGDPRAQQRALRRITFNTAWPLFVKAYVSKKAENTQNDYHFTFEGHFRRARFANKLVRNISHTDIQDYLRTKESTLSPHTLNNQVGMLAKFFNFAKQESYWDGVVNPAKALGMRYTLPKQHQVYLQKPEHQLLLIESIYTNDKTSQEKARVLTATLAWTGIRWSEARSLLWSNVFIDNPKHTYLHIETTAVGDKIQDRTKTPAGDRFVAVCPTLVKMLKKWRSNALGDTLNDEKTRLGIDPGDRLVFASDAGTLLSPGNFRRRQFDRAKTEAHRIDSSFPLDLDVHGLRHSFSMTLDRGGLSEYARSCELGHSNTRLGSTRHYTHPEAERMNPIAADAVEKSIKEGRRELAKLRKGQVNPPAPIVPAQAPIPMKGIRRKSPKVAAAATAAAKMGKATKASPKHTTKLTP